ncbi:MAG: hemolysin family protein [Cetobacterium sp.]|uniref:hemolysin family protein n=1 Tax=Cetobacterium TaxID=180162 RepID=UPI001F05574F|nr:MULTISPECIES: hemolysin family protein [Cetobacterium]MCX3067856.1 hemolysin family protein [Cetobacterium somerae]UPO97848.1 hemolysin family protein [Cetobacterium somerae]
MDTYRDIIILVVLILLSGFFSASETALTSFKTTDLEDIEKSNKKTAHLLKKWLKSPNEILTGMLLGNNIVNILGSSIATALAINIMGNSPRSLAIVTGIMTVLILIFGEITPKIMAKNNSKGFSKLVIGPMYYFGILMKPIVKILMWTSILIGRILGVEVKTENIMFTEEDLISFVNVGEAEGIIEEEEKEMIHSIVGLGETNAKEIMTPRTSMFAVEGNKTLDDIWEEMIEAGFSRIPVYEETIDNIIGVLYTKDVLNYLKAHSTDTQVKELVREAYYVPETKSIIEILQEFKSKKVHIALVLDEYGGIGGVLTIEDLLEEIVGEIRDEFDNEEEESIKEIDDNRYEVDAMLDIETINKSLNIDLPISEDYESLGGLIMSELGKIPAIGDIVDFQDVKLVVVEVEKMRVSKVEIQRGE